MVIKPRFTREGDGLSRLISLMQTLGYNDGGVIRTAIVTSDYPNIEIMLEGYRDAIPTEAIVVNPDLVGRTETVKINGVSSTIEYPNRLVKGAQVYVFEDGGRQTSYVLMVDND